MTYLKSYVPQAKLVTVAHTPQLETLESGYDAELFRVKVELVLQMQNLQNSAELLQNYP